MRYKGERSTYTLRLTRELLQAVALAARSEGRSSNAQMIHMLRAALKDLPPPNASIATIQVMIAGTDPDAARDAIAETMRDHLRRYAPQSSILDWRCHPDHPLPRPVAVSDYFTADDAWPI